jgi:hypothetical protein
VVWQPIRRKRALKSVVENGADTSRRPKNTITSEWKPTNGFNAKKRLEERKERSVNGLMDSNETKIITTKIPAGNGRSCNGEKAREKPERWSMYVTGRST